jgi:tetratricopeptide (TPR) repeat protein
MTLPEGPDLTTYTDEELNEERDFLLRSLQDLEEERRAGDVDSHDYAVLKDGYTARAAAVLRALDRRRVEAEQVAIAAIAPAREVTGEVHTSTARPPADPVPSDATGPAPSAAAPAAGHTGEVEVVHAATAAPRSRRRLRTVAVAAGVAAFAVGAGLLVANSSGQRLPGQSLSGSSPNSKVQQLLVQADADFQRSDVIGSLKTLQQVLAIDPRNVVALAQEGWVLAISGNSTHDQPIIDRGLGMIRQAESIDGTYAAAHFYAGSVLLNEGNPKAAITEFEDYLADDPSSSTAALVRGDLQTAQAEAAGQFPAGASVAPTTVPGAPAPTTRTTGPSATTSAP